MPLTLSSPTTLKEAVALQFVDRPTLRRVLGERVFDVVVKHHPNFAVLQIDYSDEEPYTLIRPDTQDCARPEGFLSVLLEAFVEGFTLAFGAKDLLRIRPCSEVARDGASGAKPGPVVADSGLPLAAMNDDLNAMLSALIPTFQRAQLAFWNADDTFAPVPSGVGRHGWMRQALRLALTNYVARSELAAEERTCVYEVLLGSAGAPSVYAIELTYSDGDQTFTALMPDLLIEAEREERRLLVRCPPSGHLQAFDSPQALGEHLRGEQATRLRFDRLSWRRRALEGDAFLQQSGLLLENLLDDLERLRLSALASSEALETAMAALSDPSRYFFNDDLFRVDTPRPQPPRWLIDASSTDRFEHQVATLDLALAQVLADGRSSLDGVEDLHTYAARRLREQLLEDYPVEANYFPDDLLLDVAVPDPATDPQLPVRLKPVGSVTLTQFAIDRLDGLENAVVTAITHRNEQLITPWMTPRYATGLVEAVDIGGRYPGYVAALLDEPNQRPLRIQRFAREWRCALLFDVLRAKVDGVIDSPCWQAVAEFCRSGLDLKSNVDIAPLGFRAQEGRQQRDEVTCMYVVTLHQPQAVLLYRPLYGRQRLLHFADQAGLMAAVSQPGELQDSVLDWLPRSVFDIYARGGFLEPHLRRVIFDTSIWPTPVKPVKLALKPFLADIDNRMYQDKREALMALADRESVSNAEHRWSMAKRFGWLLFDLLAPVLPGPLGKVAWVVGLLAPLLKEQGGEPVAGADTTLAVDLAVNLAMALLHARLPHIQGPTTPADACRPALSDPVAREPWQPPPAPVSILHDPGIASLRAYEGIAALGHGWGSGPVAQRKSLSPYRAQVDLTGVPRGNGLYHLGERFYVILHGENYEVGHDDAGRRILGPDGKWGPWLFDDGERMRIRDDGFALGGMHSLRRQTSMARDQARFDALSGRVVELLANVERHRPTIESLALAETNAYSQYMDLLDLKTRAQQNEASLSDEQVARLVALYEQKMELKLVDYKQARQLYMDGLEQDLGWSEAVVETIDQQLDLQRRRNIVTAESVNSHLDARLDASVAIVRLSWAQYFRLLDMVDYPRITRLEQVPGVAGRLALKTAITETLPMQAKLVRLSLLLDKYIPLIPEDACVTFISNTPVTIAMKKGDRHWTSVNLLLVQAQFYRDQALKYELGVSWRILNGFRKALLSPYLMGSALAHAEVQKGNLAGTNRTEVLQSAWDEYSAALINSIDIKRDGGELVDRPSLERYEQVLQQLKDDAGARLAETADGDSGASDPGVGAYQRNATPREVAYLKNGQIVVGDKAMVDGKEVLEVRDLLTGRYFTRLQRVGDTWGRPVSQDQGEPQPDPAANEGTSRPPAEERKRQLDKALQLLADEASMQRKADEYVVGAVNHRLLERLIDEHVDRLKSYTDELGDDPDLSTQLIRQKLAAWPERRRALLIRLYSQTPFPDAEALRYLHEQRLLKIDYVGPRKVLAHDSLDEYEIRLLKSPTASKGKLIWVAHFHYANQGDPATDFVEGHLKTEAQRRFGKSEAAELASQGQRIHRGRLTLVQAMGIIPFN